jgi:hypothetical protein
MTEKQESLYWRLWSRVCHVNDWRFLKGRVLPAAQRDTSEHHVAVWRCAGALAGEAHRSVTADDLRHGCHVHAIGRDRPHLELHPRTECSRVFTVFKLLIEPTDLDAQMDWADPMRDEKRVLIVGIKRIAPFAYIDQVCKGKFSDYTSPFYEDLEIGQLRQLRVTLESRKRKRGSLVEEPF